MMVCAAVALAFVSPIFGGNFFEVYAAKSQELASPKKVNVYAKSVKATLSKGRYVIRPLVSDTRALTVKDGSRKTGANIYIYTSDMATNQQFDVSYDSKGYALIRNVKSKKYISVSGKKAKKGVNVVQASKSSSKKHRWILEAAGTSYGQPVFRVRSALASKYYLQLAGSKDRDAANIRLWTKNKSKAGKFVFISTKSYAEPAAGPAIEDGIYRIGSALSSSLNLAIPGGSIRNGVAPALASKSSGSLSQLFIFTYKDGYYQIRSLVSAKSLTVKYGSVLAKAKVAQDSDKSKSYQRFKLTPRSDGTYNIISKAGGLALRVAAGAAASGRPLETYYPSSQKSQKFTLTPVSSIKLSSGVYAISPYSKDELNLSIAGASRTGGAEATATEDGRSFAQKFTITRMAGGAYSIKNAHSQLLLAADDSVVIQTKEADGGPSDDQMWYAELMAGGMRFVNKSSGMAMRLVDGDDSYGIELASPSDSTKQAFVPLKTGLFDAGQYRIDSRSDAGSLEVKGSSFFNLSNIQASAADGSGAQAWFVKVNSDGSVTVRNERSGKPIEVAGSSPGANVRQNKSSGGKVQKWYMEESGDGWYRLRSASGGNYLEADAASVDAAGNTNVRTVPGEGSDDTSDIMEWRFVPTKVKKAGPVMPKVAADAVEKEARKHLGKRYVFGAEGPGTFDCSGYVYYVMNHSGIKEMSRVTAQDIYDSCVKIPASEARRGDLVFFKNTYRTDRTVTHLGIYLGGGRMIHAGSPVQISKVNTKYYKAHFYAYARIA
jgi:cell wall-associated NlpC family hydrolase